MKCRRVEKLIPLYVEGDLASGITDRIASHLDWCGRCNWLADEYRESQSWLRSSEPPAFDETTLNGLRAGVLRRIAETSTKPSLLASLAQFWSRRQVLALSAAMLIIFGVVLFYVYQAKLGVKPSVFEATRQTDTHSAPSNETRQATDAESATKAGLSKPHRASSQARIKRRAATPMISEQTSEPSFVAQTNLLEESGSVPDERADALTNKGDDSPQMLRIEIQTSDPNIRIIWFAPKEVESPKTNQ